MTSPFLPWVWPAPVPVMEPRTEVPEGGEVPDRSRETGPAGLDVVGYQVHATDGDIGKVDEASYDVGSSRLVVDTGPWIFGRKVVVPAGLIRDVDDSERKIYISCSKEQVKESPEYDPETFDSPAHRDKVAEYYGSFYP